MRTYRAGDIAYWPDGGSLVVFLVDGAGVPAGTLVAVGKVDGELSRFANCVRDCLVTVQP